MFGQNSASIINEDERNSLLRLARIPGEMMNLDKLAHISLSVMFTSVYA